MNTLLKAESQIISHIIADNKLYWLHSTRLKDELFNEHSNLWEGIKTLVSKSERINLISLSKVAGNFDTITRICAEIKYDIDFETWLKFLEDECKKGKGTKVMVRLNEAITNNEIDQIEPILSEGLNDLSKDSTDHQDMSYHFKEVLSHIERVQTGQQITGFPTGISVFDKFTGGLHKTDLTIIAAETSQGKTTFALNVAYTTATQSNYVAIFSLEMSILQLTARLTAIDLNLSSKDILRGTADAKYISDNVKHLINNKILLDNTRNSHLDSIISKIRYYISRFKCSLFFIDYLQLITYSKKGNSTEQNLADICRTLKNIAKENDVSIVLLCQLNRDNAGSNVPKLSRLRGSGQIEEAADNVIFVLRPEPSQYGEPENAKIILSKGRNSGTGEFDVLFTGMIPAFSNR